MCGFWTESQNWKVSLNVACGLLTTCRFIDKGEKRSDTISRYSKKQAGLRWYPSGTMQHKKTQSSCHQVQILAPLLPNHRNLRKSLISLNLTFSLTKYNASNSYITWLLWLSCEVKSIRHQGQYQASRKCSINVKCKMTMAMVVMKRMLTCDSHYYEDYS